MSHYIDPDDYPPELVTLARLQRRKAGTCSECWRSTDAHAPGCPEHEDPPEQESDE